MFDILWSDRRANTNALTMHTITSIPSTDINGVRYAEFNSSNPRTNVMTAPEIMRIAVRIRARETQIRIYR